MNVPHLLNVCSNNGLLYFLCSWVISHEEIMIKMLCQQSFHERNNNNMRLTNTIQQGLMAKHACCFVRIVTKRLQRQTFYELYILFLCLLYIYRDSVPGQERWDRGGMACMQQRASGSIQTQAGQLW